MANWWSQNDVAAHTGNAASAANAWRRRAEMERNVNNKDAHGSSAWLTTAEVEQAGLFQRGPQCDPPQPLPILLGLLQSGEAVGYDAEPHLLTFAPTGAGKGVGAVIPNQMYWGSMLAVDPKGSLPAIASRFRREVLGQEVFVLDPWGISGMPSASMNPFDILDPESDDLTDDAKLLADSLVIAETGKGQFFSDTARIIVRAFILHIVTSAPRELWNVTTLSDLASRSGNDLNHLLSIMQKNDAVAGQVRKIASTIRGISEETLGNITATITRSLDFLHSPRMQKVMARSDFSFRDLKRSKMTVYLVIPEERLEGYARWLRLMLSLAILECGRERYTVKPPVLFLLDEFAALGRMEIIETAIALMRGYGIRFWPMLQDYSQLTRLYENSASSFIANSGVIQAFNVNDMDTARMLSERLGKETRNITENNTRPHEVNTSQMIGRDLLMPDEIMRLPQNAQLLLYKGLKPLMAQKISYYEQPDLKDLFDPDPFRR
jgi:type IV secretion system protein VirD4